MVIEISQDVLGRFEDGEFQRLQGWDVDLRHDDTILDRGYGSLVSPLSFFFFFFYLCHFIEFEPRYYVVKRFKRSERLPGE